MINNLLGGILGKVVDNAEGILDKVITTDKEREEAKAKIKQMLLDSEAKMQEEVTARWKSDMQSDSWLSKNIRPLLTIFSLILYTLFAISDGNIGDFNIANQYVDLLGQIVIMSLGFYFTSRGIEKTAKIWKK